MIIKGDLNALESKMEHRLWPIPKTKWSFYQEWNDVLFLHYNVNKRALMRYVPKSLELDNFDGNYWVSIVAFDMKNIRPRQLPAVPLVSDFREVNIRTYVRRGGKQGVYFLKINADNALSCLIAKTISGLPYRHAKMNRSKNSFYVKSQSSSLSIDYTVKNTILNTTALDRWLTERYALFMKENNRTFRFDIHHEPWKLKHLEFIQISIDQPEFCSLINRPPVLSHYAEGIKVLAWNKVLEVSNYS